MISSTIAILAGTALTLILCEFLRLIIRMSRYNVGYTLSFLLLSLFVPSLVYLVAFPYVGALAGMSYLFTFIGSFAGMLAGCGMLCVGVLRDSKNIRRFQSCVIAFVLISVAAVYYIEATIPHARIA